MKLTKSGKLSIKLPPELRKPLILATQQRLYYESDGLDHYAFFLLHEALQRLRTVTSKRVQLRLSEFFILLTPGTMQYLDTPTQILLREAIEEKSKGVNLDISQMANPEQLAAIRKHFLDNH